MDWDPKKSERNRLDRGFGFEFAVRIFEGDTLEWDDRRKDYGEPRVSALGEIAGRCFVVVYTPRRGTRRIISARKANKREIHAYRKAFPRNDE